MKAELDDMKEGLQTLNVLQLFQEYPVISRPLLIASEENLTAQKFQELFSIDFSPNGMGNAIPCKHSFILRPKKHLIGMHACKIIFCFRSKHTRGREGYNFPVQVPTGS